jgi:hypothetical protein
MTSDWKIIHCELLFENRWMETDRGMPRIDALNWVLNEILVLKREEEI